MNIPVSKRSIRNLTSAAICLTLCIVLPFLTGQIPKIGSALSPMHIPVLLGGFLCGPWWAMAVGFIAPLLRFALFGMPPLFPTGIAMSFELATYGLISGLLYARSSRRLSGIYASLVTAMLAGRVVWGCVMVLLMGLSGGAWTVDLLIRFWCSTETNIMTHRSLITVPSPIRWSSKCEKAAENIPPE